MARFRPLAVMVLFLFPALAPAAGHFRYTEATHGRGELKYVNGLPVLSVAGTPEEIGEQIGVLTAKHMDRLVSYPKTLLKQAGWESGWPALVRLSNALLAQCPADHRKELDAIAKHSRVDRDLIVVGNTLPDIMKIAGCSTLVVEPSRSAVKGPLFGRNLDYPTLGFLQDYTLVTVYRPNGKHAFVSIGFPGMVGCLSGMNDAGLAVATLEVYSSKDGSPRLDFKGTPYTFCFRRLLEECATVAEAEKLLRSMKRTTMNNLAVCDKQGGAVFEITSKNVVVRRSEEAICACTNHFRTPALATVRAEALAGLKNDRRFACLVGGVKEYRQKAGGLPRLGLADVARRLHAANQGELTLQTMIFEPAALRLHLACGKTPSSALPMKALELGPLFKVRHEEKQKAASRG
ncbi:MAG TPA: C45 family peptidase [Gemmataceae bacterium]|jgi:hypothetical protein|nr:C45 family peptidase [Gemmataceae bacterium]